MEKKWYESKKFKIGDEVLITKNPFLGEKGNVVSIGIAVTALGIDVYSYRISLKNKRIVLTYSENSLKLVQKCCEEERTKKEEEQKDLLEDLQKWKEQTSELLFKELKELKIDYQTFRFQLLEDLSERLMTKEKTQKNSPQQKIKKEAEEILLEKILEQTREIQRSCLDFKKRFLE